MRKNGYDRVNCVEVRTGDGTLICSLYLVEKDYPPGNGNGKRGESGNKHGNNGHNGGKKQQGNGNGNGDGIMMTDAQKRYLFRILAEQGIEGDNAFNHLLDLFQVDNLKEVTKTEASRQIETMLAEIK